MASAAGSKACLITRELAERLKEIRRKPSDISFVIGDVISVGADKPDNPSYRESSNPQYTHSFMKYE